MIARPLKIACLAGALALTTAPASAAFITLPFIGDIANPDLDPFHVMTPETPPAAASAPKKMKHHKKKKMKKM